MGAFISVLSELLYALQAKKGTFFDMQAAPGTLWRPGDSTANKGVSFVES